MGNDALNSPLLESARAARVLVAITVHFNINRLKYLAEVLRSLSDFPVAAMDIVLVTNMPSDEDLALLHRLCDEIAPGGGISIRNYDYLAHPFYLTWRHRTIISREFARGNDGKYTHFIYLEDDIRLTFANFCYFLEYREILRDTGLLPSFLRVEYSSVLNGFVSTDNKASVDLGRQPRRDAGDIVMVNIPNPYIACYVLDTALAAEFVRTRSFRRGGSRNVTEWDVRERAAMGLCFENVPDAFESRYVVPVSKHTGMALGCAWISHLPNNYADNPDDGYGKIRMDLLFTNTRGSVTDGVGETVSREPGLSNVSGKKRPRRWNGTDRYLVFPNKIIEGLRWRFGLRR